MIKNKIIVFVFIYFFSVLNLLAKNKEFDSIEYYKDRNELIKAINYAKSKTEYYLAHDEYENYIKLNFKKSKIYNELNDKPKALKVLYNSLGVAEKNKLDFIKTEIYLKLADEYSSIRDTIKASKNYYKAKENGEKHQDFPNLSHVYQNLFRLNTSINLDTAYYYLQKKINIDRLTKSNSGLATSYNNYFAYHSLKNEIEIGKVYLDSSITLCRKYKYTAQLVNSLHNLGYYYMVEKQDFKKAIKLYLDLKDELKDEIDNKDLNELYSNLIYAYEQVGDYEKANYYNTLYKENLFAIYNDKLIDAVRDVETKYKIEKVESEFNIRQKTLEDKQTKNRKIIFVFVCLLAFSFILFYFFYQNLQLKQSHKIKELESEIQQNIINANLDGREIERKKIAEILHDNISALLSSAGLHLSAFLVNIEGETPEEIKKARSLMKEAHDKVRDLSHELIPPVLAKLGLVHALNDLIEKNSNSLINFNVITSISDRKRYSEDFEIKIYFIVTELINNIIKHSNASEGTISIEEENEELHIQIDDNGKGFDENKSQTNDGFGLTQIKARIKKLNGVIKIKSKKDKGSKIFFKVKIP